MSHRIGINSLKLYKQLQNIFGEKRYVLVPTLQKNNKELEIIYVDIYSLASGFKVHTHTSTPKRRN